MTKYFNFIIMALTGFLISCHPEPEPQKLIDELAVATDHDPAADFTSFSTYAIPTDTIGFVSNKSNDTLLTANKSDFPRPVLKAIRSNLNARGYTEVTRNQNPDMGVNVLVVNDYDVFQQVIYPNYYGGYGNSYYSGYYGYNSYYYPYVNTYAYNTGILIIEIVDLKNETPDFKVKVIWNAYMGDVYSTVDLMKQTEKAINQAFTQSPYLSK